MPTKNGGGNREENYDPNTGRYCKVHENGIIITKEYDLSLERKNNFDTLSSGEKNSSLMPNFSKSITPDEKFTKYSLDEANSNGKSIVYKSALGYTNDNFQSLKQQIHNAITSGKAKLYEIKKDSYYDKRKEKIMYIAKYEYHIPVTGPNGKTKDVVAVYGINQDKTIPKMITNYVL